MIKKISEEFKLKVKGHKDVVEGEKFRKFFQRINAKKKFKEFLERKSYPFFVIEILICEGVADIEFLQNKKNMKRIQHLLEAKEKDLAFELTQDEEYGTYELAVKFQINGMSVTSRINLDLINSTEYKNLFKIYKELESFVPPFEVISDLETVKIENENKLLDYLFEKGKKGIVIQRYKGLGEMTPEQLWETTMNPENRSLLKVSIQDAVEADEVFSILMGDEVEQRRQFIENNALLAQNLDI